RGLRLCVGGGRRRGLGGGRLCGRGCYVSLAFLDLTEQRADRDGLAVLRGNLAKRSGGGRRHLDGHLVGLELDDRLVDRDGIARFLEPFANGRLGDGLAQRRDADFSHDGAPVRRGRQAPVRAAS